MQAHVETMRFSIGQRVSFDQQGGGILVTLVKYNRKTVTVVTDNGQRWNISPHLLSPLKDAGTTEPEPSGGSTKKK